MNEEEKIQLAIDRIDSVAETLATAVAKGSVPHFTGRGVITGFVSRTHTVCTMASWLKDTSRLLATIGKE